MSSLMDEGEEMADEEATSKKVEELKAVIQDLQDDVQDLRSRVEESHPKTVAEEVRQKADHIERQAQEINKAVMQLQTEGVPLEDEKTFEEVKRKLGKFMKVVGQARSLGEIQTAMSEEYEREMEDLKEAWKKNLNEIRQDKETRKGVTNDLQNRKMHLTWVAGLSSLGGVVVAILIASILVWYGVPVLPQDVRMTPEERERVKAGKKINEATRHMTEDELERYQELYEKGQKRAHSQNQQ